MPKETCPILFVLWCWGLVGFDEGAYNINDGITVLPPLITHFAFIGNGLRSAD